MTISHNSVGIATPRAAGATRGGHVYLIGSELSRHVKIGYTTRKVDDRLKELQTGHPGKLHIIGEWAGTPEAEAKLHAAFAKWRTQGEWFDFQERDAYEEVSAALQHCPSVTITPEMATIVSRVMVAMSTCCLSCQRECVPHLAPAGIELPSPPGGGVLYYRCACSTRWAVAFTACAVKELT